MDSFLRGNTSDISIGMYLIRMLDGILTCKMNSLKRGFQGSLGDRFYISRQIELSCQYWSTCIDEIPFNELPAPLVVEKGFDEVLKILAARIQAGKRDGVYTSYSMAISYTATIPKRKQYDIGGAVETRGFSEEI